MATVAEDSTQAVLVFAIGHVAVAVVPATMLAAPEEATLLVKLPIGTTLLLAKKLDVILIYTLNSASVMSNALYVHAL